MLESLEGKGAKSLMGTMYDSRVDVYVPENIMGARQLDDYPARGYPTIGMRNGSEIERLQLFWNHTSVKLF